MKKFLTLPNILKCLAAVLGIVAFVFAFVGDHLVVKSGNTAAYLPAANALFGGKVTLLIITATYNGAVLSFIGYLLAGVAALLTGANLFVTSKTANKVLPLLNAALFIVAGVFIILEASLFNSANELKDNWQLGLTAMPILAAVFAWLGGLLNCGAAFLTKK